MLQQVFQKKKSWFCISSDPILCCYLSSEYKYNKPLTIHGHRHIAGFPNPRSAEPSHTPMLGVIKTVWSQTIFLCLSHTLFFVEQMCHCFTYNRFSYGFLQSHYYRRPYFFWSSVVIPCYNITNAIIVIILLNCLHIKKNRSSPQQANTHLQ